MTTTQKFDIKRNDIKTAFMAIFYGQGFLALCDKANYTNDISGLSVNDSKKNCKAIWDHLNAMSVDVEEWHIKIADTTGYEPQIIANAFSMYSSICTTFGRVNSVREAIKLSIKGKDGITKIDKPVAHTMPDGTVIRMNEKVRLDTDMQMVGKRDKTEAIRVNGVILKSFKVKTNQDDLDYDRRNTFVNMIQGTDALLGKLITVNTAKAGATHFIGVHDCFRVDINSYIAGALDTGIKESYKELFTDAPSDYLNHSNWVDENFVGPVLPVINKEKNGRTIPAKDILANMFAGIEKSKMAEFAFDTKPVMQTTRGSFRVTNCRDGGLVDTIEQLENKYDDTEHKSFFFSK